MNRVKRASIMAAAAVLAAGGALLTSGGGGSGFAAPDSPVVVTIDAGVLGEPISPLIRGINGDLSVEEMVDVGIELVAWGGNPNSRFNYQIGHAWNTARDYEYRNVNYIERDADAAREYLASTAAAGAQARLAVPTLGWIARDDALENCSFPDGQGNCLTPDADCRNPGPIADPALTSIESTPEMVAEWIRELVAEGIAPAYVAMDNEPDLWGYTHYDVHPECPTFEEILERHLEYAAAIRGVDPGIELWGPVMCCWYDYWNESMQPADGTGRDFLSWFLDSVRLADESSGVPSIDVVDLHYYPQSDVYNDNVDPETSARRLRSTRSLWDRNYVDESWINDRIAFIPRMREIIEANYPGLPIAITEWNFGAEESMNGALAIADALGIFGREGVHASSYWRSPDPLSPGYFAFKMHGNYDGAGTAFEGTTADATSSHEALASFAALDESGVLRVMFVNKDPDSPIEVDLQLTGFAAAGDVRQFTYGPDDPSAIVESVTTADALVVPAYSIVVVELRA